MPEFTPDETDTKIMEEIEEDKKRAANAEKFLERVKVEEQVIGLFFPEGTYSANKKEIKKIIKEDLELPDWNGTGWEGDNGYIDTVFLKTQQLLEREVQYQGDILWYHGHGNYAVPLIMKCYEVGGYAVIPVKKEKDPEDL